MNKTVLFFIVAIVSSMSVGVAQNLGCTYTFAPEYDPAADVNDGTCTYNVQTLLDDGYCLAELLGEGLPPEVFYGLHAISATDVSYNPTGRMTIGHIHPEYNEVYYIYETVGNSGSSYPNHIWGCYGTNIVTTDGWQAGIDNTIVIVTAGCSLNDNETSAAEYAYNFEAFGYDDWYLPSAPELGTIMENMAGNYSFSQGEYYSTSSQYNDIHYVMKNGQDPGSEWQKAKDQYSAVRVIRVEGTDAGCSGATNDDCAFWPDQAASLPDGISCSYPLFNCDSLGSSVWSELPSDIYPKDASELQFGLPWNRDLQLNWSNEIASDDNTYDVVSITVNGVSGLPQGLSCELPSDFSSSSSPSGSVECLAIAGAPLEEGSFELQIDATVFIEFLGGTVELGDVQLSHAITVIENTDGIPGCMYEWANNYNQYATEDDLSCLIDGENACQEDFDGNGIVGVGDILHLLGTFGNPCE